MERTDWLDEGLSSAEACFLMLTAITHHKFSSPAWGEHEVRKLHAKLAELDRLDNEAPAKARAARPTPPAHDHRPGASGTATAAPPTPAAGPPISTAVWKPCVSAAGCR